MKKRIGAFLLALALGVGLLPSAVLAARDLSEPTRKAEALKALGLFKGVSESNLDLSRAPSREEALVIFLRLLGEEEAALAGGRQMPFDDVPAWAGGYVAYAYAMGYTKGISATRFGAGDAATAPMYLTFLLRALGYSDGAGGDFTWQDPMTLARAIDILPQSVDLSTFLRADAALIAWETLFVPMKGGNKDLCDILEMGGAFSREQLEAAVAIAGSGTGGSGTADGVTPGTYICRTDANGFTYDPRYLPIITLNADKTFTIVINFGEGMQDGTGTWRFWAEEGSDERYIFFSVTTTPWYGSTDFTLYYGSAGLIVSDGYIGITPVESVYQLQR